MAPFPVRSRAVRSFYKVLVLVNREIVMILIYNIYSTDKERDIRKQNIMYGLCDIYDNTASYYKKQNDVIEIIQENKRYAKSFQFKNEEQDRRRQQTCSKKTYY